MITAIAGVSTLIFIGVGAVVGARLLWLARRSRGLPETTLGLGLFLIVGVGYPITLLAPELEARGLVGRAISSAGSVVMGIGWSAVWVFTWRVFRPGRKSACAVSLVAIGTLMAFSGWPAVALLSGGQTLDVGERTVASLGVQLTAMAVYLWSGTESGLEWTQARKRMRLGLSDPVVTNRFLLWLLVMFFSFASLVGPVTGTFLGILVHESPVIQLGAATAGLACAVCLTLAFLPPRFYLARIEQPATA